MKNKIILITVIIIYLISLFCVIDTKTNFKEKINNTKELNEAFKKMKSLNNVTINIKATQKMTDDQKRLEANNIHYHENMYEYIYKYDVKKKWGDVKYNYTGYTDEENKKEEENNYYFVHDNNVYKYYSYNDKFIKQWSKAYDNIFLDLYLPLLDMLSDYDSIKKNKDDNYVIVAKNTNINIFNKYYTSTFSDSHFPIRMFSAVIPESRYFKFILTINSNNYISNIYVDTSDYTKSISSYNISFSDYNNSTPNIPYGILETFEE